MRMAVHYSLIHHLLQSQRDAAHVDIVLFDQLAQIDQGVAHTAEGGIDAHSCVLGDLLEAEIKIVAQHDDFFLLLRQHLYQALELVLPLHYIHMDLMRHLVKLQYLKYIIPIAGHDAGTALDAAEVVYAHIIRYPHHPWQEFTFVIVFAGAQSVYHLDESLLKDVFSQVGVFDHHIDGGVNLVFVAGYKAFKSRFVAGEVLLQQILIAH